MFDSYNMKYFFTPVMMSSNVLIRLRDALVEGLHNFNKLPRVILVLIGRDFKKFTELPGLCDDGVVWLLTQLYTRIETRKGQMDKKCYRASEPKFIFIKPTPLYEKQDVFGKERELRRYFNKVVEKTAKKFKYYFVQNLAEIAPNKKELYDICTYSLSKTGYLRFWSNINNIIRKLDRDELKQCMSEQMQQQLVDQNQKSDGKRPLNGQKRKSEPPRK